LPMLQPSSPVLLVLKRLESVKADWHQFQ